MRYLVIDAYLNGSGIRDKYEGESVLPEDLGLSMPLLVKLSEWLLKYEKEHFKGYSESTIVDELDQEGISIARAIKNELTDVKLEYFSDAKMTSIMI